MIDQEQLRLQSKEGMMALLEVRKEARNGMQECRESGDELRLRLLGFLYIESTHAIHFWLDLIEKSKMRFLDLTSYVPIGFQVVNLCQELARLFGLFSIEIGNFDV